MSFMDDFDSVMNKVMEELENDTSSDTIDENALPKEVFGEMEEFVEKEQTGDNDLQKDTDDLIDNAAAFDPGIEVEVTSDLPADIDDIESLAESEMENISPLGLKEQEEYDEAPELSIEEMMDEPFEPSSISRPVDVDKIKVDGFQESLNTGSFSVDLEGIMGVDIRLKFGEKEFFLSCDGEHLIVKMGDGTSFTIPLRNLEKKAA
ncbi:MAG: hypothetical protein JXA66_05380 [Oligoflexia bacterium]|nr:hypothetical protein [Oligoflexia bacterium]